MAQYPRRMRADLEQLQRPVDVDQGKITGADGITYARRSTKTKRAVAQELVAAGTPLVLDMYGRGQFEWLDGDDATAAWAQIRDYITTAEPTPKQLAKHEMWTTGIWESDESTTVLYLTGYC